MDPEKFSNSWQQTNAMTSGQVEILTTGFIMGFAKPCIRIFTYSFRIKVLQQVGMNLRRRGIPA